MLVMGECVSLMIIFCLCDASVFRPLELRFGEHVRLYSSVDENKYSYVVGPTPSKSA